MEALIDRLIAAGWTPTEDGGFARGRARLEPMNLRQRVTIGEGISPPEPVIWSYFAAPWGKVAVGSFATMAELALSY